jgi:hypothetical protein
VALIEILTQSVVLLVFDFDEFSEGVLNPHSYLVVFNRPWDGVKAVDLERQGKESLTPLR